MSLINDALRKARQDGGDVGDERQDRMGHSHTKTSRLGVGLILGAAIALTAAIVGGTVAVWILGSRDDQQPPIETLPTQIVQSAPSDDPVSSSPAPFREPTVPERKSLGSINPPVNDTRLPSSAPAEDEPPTPPSATSEILPTLDALPDSSSPIEDSVPAEVDSLSPIQSPEAQSRKREFVLDADLGYARLSLDFIIIRGEDPFAEINGTEVHEGSEIEGFIVDKIESTRVTLHDARGTLILRTK
ncbi:MAG: hypothetical protein GY906_36070 [bacterium]|nr:hypothetical protein [bacterium]